MAGALDFDADGWPDLLFQNQATGDLAAWDMIGVVRRGSASLTPRRLPDLNWSIVAPSSYRSR